MSHEFLLTSLIVVLLPGTGVLYTVSIGLTRGALPSVAAAIGCTFGIVPHLVASVLGLAALLHASAVAFQLVKFVGVAYLLYLAWGMWRDSGEISFDSTPDTRSARRVAVRGLLINVLNPKLSVFFLAFLPQFVAVDSPYPSIEFVGLGLVFMALTFVVFIGYGFGANAVRRHVVDSPRVVQGVQRCFAGLFVALGVRLAMAER